MISQYERRRKKHREPKPRSLFTPREREIAAHLAAGNSVRRIAFELDICDNTVKTLARTVYRKLGLEGGAGKRARLWVRMQELGL